MCQKSKHRKGKRNSKTTPKQLFTILRLPECPRNFGPCGLFYPLKLREIVQTFNVSLMTPNSNSPTRAYIAQREKQRRARLMQPLGKTREREETVQLPTTRYIEEVARVRNILQRIHANDKSNK